MVVNMARRRGPRTRAARRTPAGQALFQVVLETLATFFRLRAAGARAGAVTAWGGGTWGFLRTLRLEGPRTVPQIARARPVARQHIQKLANELAEAGLVEFVDNPEHQRSRLLRLTPRGEARFQELTERVLDLCERLARGMDPTELRTAAAVLARLRARLDSAEPPAR